MKRLALGLTAAGLLALLNLGRKPEDTVRGTAAEPTTKNATITTPPAPEPPTKPSRPIANPAPPKPTQSVKLDLRELPFPVPYFDDAGDRAKFKRWWTDDFVARVELWKLAHPERAYPSDTRNIAARLYDASEPPPPGASPSQADAHHRELSARLKEFLDAFGDAPGSIVSWTGHQHVADKPPVLPAGWSIAESTESFDVASTTAPPGFVPGPGGPKPP